MKIGHREIGPEHPPLIIVELGIAHRGSMEAAKGHMIWAKERGAECVKLQTHIPEAEMTPDHPWWNIINEAAFTEEQEAELHRYARDLGMIALSTPYSVEAVDRLERIGVPAYKVGSGEVTHEPMLRAINDTKKPVIMSTGMHTRFEVSCASHLVLRDCDVKLLACLSQYPALPEQIDMDEMMRDRDGWSDHTGDIGASLAAVAYGAQVVEVHFPRFGPDAESSVSEDDLGVILSKSRQVWRAVRPPRFSSGTATIRRIAEHRPENGWRRAP